MTNSTPIVLAVGAAGRSAGLVVPELVKRGARVRGLVRDAGQGEAVRGRGAEEVAVVDLRDRGSLDAALEGVDSVFYIAPAFIPGEAEVGKGMVDSAKRAGVRRFVFSSVIDPAIRGQKPYDERNGSPLSSRSVVRTKTARTVDPTSRPKPQRPLRELHFGPLKNVA